MSDVFLKHPKIKLQWERSNMSSHWKTPYRMKLFHYIPLYCIVLLLHHLRDYPALPVKKSRTSKIFKASPDTQVHSVNHPSVQLLSCRECESSVLKRPSASNHVHLA